MIARPSRRDRLQAAADLVAKHRHAGVSPRAILADLVAKHGAKLKTGDPRTNRLTIAGTTATCTWSEDKGLLEAWVKNATIRLMKLDGRCE